jgi:hypothetical protein
VLATLHSERFIGAAPPTVYPTLLDEGIYLCSVLSIYRILRAQGEVRERRWQAVHPAHVKPELLAAHYRLSLNWNPSLPPPVEATIGVG